MEIYEGTPPVYRFLGRRLRDEPRLLVRAIIVGIVFVFTMMLGVLLTLTLAGSGLAYFLFCLIGLAVCVRIVAYRVKARMLVREAHQIKDASHAAERRR